MELVINKRKAIIWAVAVLAFALLLLGIYLAGLRKGIEKAQKEFKPDTTIIHHYDTITVTKPKLDGKKTVDTIYVPIPVKADTVTVRDTIALPREQMHYRDTTYEAWVSGFEPSLDSINIFRHSQTIYIDKVVTKTKKTRFGIGVQVGYGATLQGKTVTASPYIGLGISYNIFTF